MREAYLMGLLIDPAIRELVKPHLRGDMIEDPTAWGLYEILMKVEGRPDISAIRMDLSSLPNSGEIIHHLEGISNPMSPDSRTEAIKRLESFIRDKKVDEAYKRCCRIGVDEGLPSLKEAVDFSLSDGEDIDVTHIPDSEIYNPDGTLQLLRMEEVELSPSPEFLIEDFLVKNSYTVVHGKWESLKTLIFLEASRALVTQTPFLGRFQVREKCKVLYVDDENAKEYLKRAKKGLGFENTPDFSWCHQKGFKVDSARYRKALFKTIKKEGFNVIIFDALVRMHDKNENTAEMKEIGNFFSKLARRGITVIVIHHDNRSEDYRGSSDIPGAADQFYSFEYIKGIDGGTSILKPEKNKMAATKEIKTNVVFSDDDTIEFSVQDGDFVNTKEGKSEEENARKVAEILSLYEEGRNATDMEMIIRNNFGLSIPAARDLREKYTGRFWTVEPGPNNSKIYKVLDLQGAAV